jgi:hypothetical protein
MCPNFGLVGECRTRAQWRGKCVAVDPTRVAGNANDRSRRGAATMSFECRQEIKSKSRQVLPPISRALHLVATLALVSRRPATSKGSCVRENSLGDSLKVRMFTSRVPGALMPVMSCPRSRGSVRVDRLGRGC